MPGAALGGYLGAQTGSGGANGVDAWDKYYYHFSDLGTVLATTDGDGAMLGVYQPDFWGNYRETSGTRPDTMGLTGKFFDNDTDLYYFNARWYDPERGRFVSKDPGLMKESRSFYNFSGNVPTSLVDLNGRNAQAPIDDIRSHFQELCKAIGQALIKIANIKKSGGKELLKVKGVPKLIDAFDEPCDFLVSNVIEMYVGDHPSRPYWETAMELYCNGVDCALKNAGEEIAGELIDKTLESICNKRWGVFEDPLENLQLQNMCTECVERNLSDTGVCQGICDLANQMKQ